MTRVVLQQALAIVSVGLVLGGVIAMWGRSAAVVLIPGLSVQSPAPVAFGAGAIVAVALIASCVPARNAARVDPMEALRHE